MDKKKQHNAPEDATHAIDDSIKKAPQAEAQEDTAEENAQEEVSVEEQLQKAQEEIQHLKDNHLRQLAEFDNYRKRTLKEKAELILNGGEKVITAFLPILDDLARAQENIEKNQDYNTLKEGVDLIVKKLYKVLGEQGLSVIEAEGQPFDTDYFEAVALVPVEDDAQKGKITLLSINMATETDFYKILGVEKTASAEEIKSAYKKIAIKYHPDRNPGDKEAEEKFRQAAEAYDVLRDPEKRSRYDQFGKAGVEGGFGGFGGAGMDLNDIFSHFGDIFGDMGFGGFRGGFHQQSKTRKFQGSDLRLKVKLTLQEIAKGTTKKFKVKKDVTCKECNGSGAAQGSHPETCTECNGAGVVLRTHRTMFGMMQSQEVCPRCHGEGHIIKDACSHCHGEGVVSGEEIIEVNIPAGVADGMIVNVEGKGNAGRHNGIPGNIQVIISEESDEDLIRDGQDIIYNLLLTISQATLGDAVEIPTIDGKARIKIAPGTQPGTTLRLRGKGLPAVRGYGYGVGDIVVNISIYIPETLSKAEKESFEAMKDSDNLRSNPSIKEKIFKAFRNYFNA